MKKSSEIRVAIVDDDELMLEQVKLCLQALHIESPLLFSSGHHFLSRLEKLNDIDLVILDLNMPIIDGVEVIRRLAKVQFQGALVLFSGEDYRILKTAESLANASQLYVLGVMSKPVTPNDLSNLLSKLEFGRGVEERKKQPKINRADLVNAISTGKIFPLFQPKLDKQEKMLSAEVLARWKTLNNELLSPSSFIPVAEESKVIEQLTYSIFRQSLEHYSVWLKKGYDFKLAVNLSVENLNQLDLPDRLADMAREFSVPTKNIIFELTESTLMENLIASLDVLSRMRLKGFELSIDDFGTGYSSMEKLNRIPFNELKIDRAFVHDAHESPAAAAILESSSNLAKKLNMTTVAEGVENEKDWENVLSVGCDLIQGYYRAVPMDAKTFDKWLQTKQQ